MNKLKTRLLSLPAIAIVLMVALGVIAGLSLGFEHRAMERVRHYGNLESTILEIRSDVSEFNARAYRLLNVIAGLDDSRITTERRAIADGFARLATMLEDTAATDPDGIGLHAFDLVTTMNQLAGMVDNAIDLGSVDPNTGSGSMQSADVLFDELTRNIDVAFESTRQATEQAAADATAIARNAQYAMAGAAVLAAILLVALSLLIARAITRPLLGAVDLARSIADGDLGREVETGAFGEVGELQTALGEMRDALHAIVSQVRESSIGITSAATEVAVGNNDLSARTEQTASNLEETAASIEHLTQTVRTNADNARQANQLALSASEVAERGGEVVGNVVTTMETITESSRRIAEIISVIDSIAFQTNILALNAAVEAARAGEQGRGFAVVAGEVRNLAQRSSSAANEIKELITASVGEVDNGARLVREAGATMSEIVTSVRRVTDIMGEISAATNEQSIQISEVNAAVAQLDQMTQQNAALVEEGAASAESLKEQAGALNGIVSAFRLASSGHAHRDVPTAPPSWWRAERGSGTGRGDEAEAQPKYPATPAWRAPGDPHADRAEARAETTPAYERPIPRRSPGNAAPMSAPSEAASPRADRARPAPSAGEPGRALTASTPRGAEDDWETF